MPVKIIYWGGIKARSYAVIALCQGAGVEYELVTTLPSGDPLPWKMAGTEIEPILPFGQLPVAQHNDVTIGESLAILRYVGRVAGD